MLKVPEKFTEKTKPMLFLSELYGRIGQILREHGDMEVARMQSLLLDGMITNQCSGFMEYDNTDFSVHITEMVSGNDAGTGHTVASRKRFLISPFGNGKPNKDRY